VAGRKLDQINRATELGYLKVPPGNRLKVLAGDREGQHGIRINDQYRICFRWVGDDAHDVEITDYH
ncbi:MAG: type II toxin-antitoxin system RelE/ParE family toxin, partial [Gemmatimonadales bacterium]|nr:type II toxin-antitoxin system RelE/ParE family toxin [Gemmatimonadales bacterium]